MPSALGVSALIKPFAAPPEVVFGAEQVMELADAAWAAGKPRIARLYRIAAKYFGLGFDTAVFECETIEWQGDEVFI